MSRKEYIPEKEAGIWLDQEHAYIIIMRLEGKSRAEVLEVDLQEEYEELEKNQRSDHQFMNKSREGQENQHRLNFYKRLVEQIKDINYVYLFGPGNSKHQFSNYIERSGKRLPLKVAAIDSADKLTQPQMIEQVKSYFASLRFEDFKRTLFEEQNR